ncbi:epoxide hydrolase [Phlyctema vagabunda]|uniref:Epoxide hydrolase n=1 Tax=Phlyctema vagabunda TaxID=108571 RepID=A0ABR4P8J0_9HELO
MSSALPQLPPGVSPFTIDVSQEILQELQTKLKLRRFPGQQFGDKQPDSKDRRVNSKENGLPVVETEVLAKYWLKEFDWRKQESELNNKHAQFTTSIAVEGEDAFGIHFIWEQSRSESAIPLLMVHGWPSSPFEFTKIIKDLANPSDPAHPSFHCVAPSLPGHAFSQSPTSSEFGIMKTAQAFHILMKRLGYQRYFVYGCDWGSFVCRALALQYPENVRGTHQNMVLTKTPSVSYQKLKFLKLALSVVTGGGVIPGTYSPREVKNLNHVQKVVLRNEMGYNQMMSTKPLTVSYGLTDSPVGLLAWIWEKLESWSDDYPWTNDEILTWVMIYWVAGIYDSAQLYKAYQKEREILTSKFSKVPLGVSLFEGDLFQLPDDFAEMLQPVHFRRIHPRGGHFPGYEQPDLLVGDIREYISTVIKEKQEV